MSEFRTGVILDIPPVHAVHISKNLIKYRYLKSMQGEIYIPVQALYHFNIFNEEEGT
jgi:hypothetical protein